MKIIVIDGQGGGMGRAFIEAAKKEIAGVELLAVGTNALATMAMMKAGAAAVATGENAIIRNCADADIIVGAMGIVLANSMLGELSPAMAQAVGSSRAIKILIPVSKCRAHVAGVADKNIAGYIADAVSLLKQYCE